MLIRCNGCDAAYESTLAACPGCGRCPACGRQRLTRKQLANNSTCPRCGGPIRAASGRCDACGELRTFDVGPCECGHRNDPEQAALTEQQEPTSPHFHYKDLVRVVEGPLAGLRGIVQAVDEKHQVATVLLSAKDNKLLPPLPLRYNQIKAIPGFILMRICMFASMLVVVAVIVRFGWDSAISHCSEAVWGAIWIATYFWLGHKSKQLRTCPSCSGALDSDTSYSTCTACSWVRPMPDAGRRHLEEFFPTGWQRDGSAAVRGDNLP